jgi:predicted RNA-binding protein with TRAM domain
MLVDQAIIYVKAGKGGDGLARVEGFVVFVPGANVGDEVKVRITSVRRRFATAEVVTE